MNPALKERIQKLVWEKITQVSEEEYNRHVHNFSTNANYQVLTINTSAGFFIYHYDDPPDFGLLEQVIKNQLKDKKNELDSRRKQNEESGRGAD